MDWDPVTGRVGIDQAFIRQGGVRLDSSFRALTAHVTAANSGAVTAVSVPVVGVEGAPTIKCEVYDFLALSSSPNTSTYYPNEDLDSTLPVTGTAVIAGTTVDTAGNRYQNIDEATTNDADYIQAYTLSGSGTASYRFRVNSSAGFGAGDQTVSAVRLYLRLSWTQAPDSRVNVYWNNGTSDYLIASYFMTSPQVKNTFETTLYTNPATGLAWTEAEVQGFDSTSHFKVLFTLNGVSTINIHQAFVEVDWRNQTLRGSASVTVSSDGLAVFPISFTKTATDIYDIIFRRTSTSGSCVINTLDTGETNPIGLGTYLPTLDEAGTATDWGDLLTPIAPVLFTVGGSYDGDSQPYYKLRREPVDATHTVVQEITRPSTATIGWLSTVAASARSVVPAAPLLGKIKNSGGTQQGGTATFGTELVEDAPLTPRAVDTTMASTVSLTNATQYDVEWTSTAPEGEGWTLTVLEAYTGTGAATFGGTTDRGEVDGAEDDLLDVVTVMGTVPTAPSGLTATADTSGEGSIVLAWSATSLAGSFERYEIERLHPDDTWRLIATVATEATVTYTDEAARRGVEETYRIRVRHTNGTVSLPSTSDSETLTKRHTYIVSPSTPTLSHRVVIVGNQLAWDHTLERVQQYRYGSDYASVVKGRRRGKTLAFTILLDEGPESFASQDDWVRDLEDADDLVLVNEFGERWFIDLSAPAGSSLSPAAHLLPVSVVETSKTQTVVEVP